MLVWLKLFCLEGDNMLNLINASQWQAVTRGAKTYYSPNGDLLRWLADAADELHAEFWQRRYTEFACLVVDKSSQSLDLVRDHFGCEPFFYSLTAESLYFASSIVDLIVALKLAGIEARVNEAELPYLLWSSKRLDLATAVHEDTVYHNIKRVKPNHRLTIRGTVPLPQVPYWDVAQRSADKIYYRDEREYLEHFSELLHEGICLQLGDENAIAAECSGGLDSSTIIVAAHQLGAQVKLFTHHDADYDPASPRLRESYFIEQILQKSGFAQESVDATAFDLPAVLQQVSSVLAGFPQTLFPIGANNIHARVGQSDAKILLSGFGGDECVSSHASLSRVLYELIQAGKYSAAWVAYHQTHKARGMQPPALWRQLKDLLAAKFPQVAQRRSYQRYLVEQRRVEQVGLSLPGYVARAKTVAEHEIMLLIGARNNHLSCRIEDSALMARHYGFRYKYPFLYPKLVEFCNRLPLDMKRRNGLARIMVRDYLAQTGLSDFTTKPIAKSDGNIMGSTIRKMLASYRSDFALRLEQPLAHSEWLKIFRALDPKMSESMLMYQDLAVLSLANDIAT